MSEVQSESVMSEPQTGNYQAVCRLCLSDEAHELKSVFDACFNHRRLPHKIHQLTSIQVFNNDKFSTMVCNNCINKLENWHSYKKECLQNQTKLAEWFNKSGGPNITEMTLHIKSEPVENETDLEVVNGVNGFLPVKVEIEETESMEEEYNDLPPTLTPYAIENTDHYYLEDLQNANNVPEDERKCTECNKMFSSVANRRRHELNTHKTELRRIPMNEIKRTEPQDVARAETDDSSKNGMSFETSNEVLINTENDTSVPRESETETPMETQENPLKNQEKTTESQDKSSEIQDQPIESQDNTSENQDTSTDNTDDPSKILDKPTEPQDKPAETQDKPTETQDIPTETQDKPIEMQDEPSENSENEQQKIQFAAGLQLLQKDSHPIEFEPLSKIELSYIEKCKAMVSMFHTLQCACHNVQFKNLRNLLSHLRELRVWFPMFTCYSCMISFTDRSTFTKHYTKCTAGQLETLTKLSNIRKRSDIKIRLYQNYKCNRCKFLFTFYDDYCKHVNEEHVVGDPPFYCTCRYVFDSTEEYKKHCQSQCLLSYYCDICFATTTSVEDFLKHCQGIHDESEGFILLQEDNYSPRKSFQHKEADDESLVVTGKRERRQSVKKPILVQIYDTELPEDPKNISTKTIIHKMMKASPTTPINYKSPAKCPVCKKEYSSVHNMVRHYRAHLERNEVTPLQASSTQEENSSNSYYSCPDCGGMYSSANWVKHIQEKHPIKNCSECDKVFQFQTELDQHRSVHLNLKVYRDSKTHSYKSTIISPGAEDSEINDVMVMCEVCDAMFNTKDDLKQHKLTHQEGHSVVLGSGNVIEFNTVGEAMPVLEMKDDMDSKDSKERIDSPTVVKHECDKCQRVYSCYKSLKEHMKNKHATAISKKSEYPKKCDYCDKICTTGAALYLHRQMHERMTLGDLKKSKPAPVKARKKSAQDRHEDEESYHTCKRCFKVFATKGKLKDHMKCHGISASKPGPKSGFKKASRKVLCDLCHVALESTEELTQHKMEDHSEELDGMPLLTNEMEVDIKTPIVFTCDVCVMTFNTKFALKKHKETHVMDVKPAIPKNKNNTSFNCKYCKITFDSTSELTKHMHTEHDESAKPKLTREKSKEKDKSFKCPICKKGFASVGAMNAHAGWHKRNKSNDVIPAENTPQATTAAKVTRQVKVLKKLAETASSKSQPIKAPEFQCMTCLAELPNDTALQIHILEKHRSVDAIMLIPRCNICNQDFATQDEYEIHKRFHDFLERQKKHEEQMQTSSQRSSSNASPVLQSVKQASGVKPKSFPCSYCMSSFSRNDTLNTHVKQHHKEHVKSEFKCNQCDRVFDKQNSLSIHLKVHEKQKSVIQVGVKPPSVMAGGKVYSCSICNRAFSFPKDLRMHTIKEHPF